ncbi:unnamed protein product, partial [Ixodes hexagonus]
PAAVVLELSCPVQTYHWGKKGTSSLVAQLASQGGHLSDVDEKTTYAELWMGTHPTRPSKIKGTEQTLADWILEHPESLGEGVRGTFGGQLPFLFKVLSVDTALSIQAHPAKGMAALLHSSQPDKYPDANHKPEIAIALTEFDAFCNFRPLPEIAHLIKGLPELRAILGEEAELPLHDKEALQRCFRKLMTTPPDVFIPMLKKMADRLRNSASTSIVSKDLANVFLKIYTTYPEDIGCFVIFFLNFIRLSPGEALFLAANEPHAYISGNCVECMACSDNVVRAGLTPKFKDVDTLCSMLSYNSIPVSDVRFPATPRDIQCCSFEPPIPDFAVNKIQVPAGGSYTPKSVPSASILLVIEGEGRVGAKAVKRGSILFLVAGKAAAISATEAMQIYQAYSPA